MLKLIKKPEVTFYFIRLFNRVVSMLGFSDVQPADPAEWLTAVEVEETVDKGAPSQTTSANAQHFELGGKREGFGPQSEPKAASGQDQAAATNET